MSALLALLSSALWGTSDYLGGVVSRRLPVVWVLALAQAAALVALVPLVVLLGVTDVPRHYVVPGALAGLVGLGSLAAFYRALATGTMGVVAPIAALGVVVPVAAGLLEGERPGVAVLVGIVVAVVGVVLASRPQEDGPRGRVHLEPVLLAVAAAVGFGLVLLLVARGSAGEGSEDGSVLMVLLTMRLTVVTTFVLALLVVLTLGRRPPRRPGRQDLPMLVVIGLFDVAANGCFAVASRSALVSVTSVLASLYPVVTSVLAARFDGERLGTVQRGGAVLALAGVVLIAGG